MHVMSALEVWVLLAAAACALSWVFGELHGAARARTHSMMEFALMRQDVALLGHREALDVPEARRGNKNGSFCTGVHLDRFMDIARKGPRSSHGRVMGKTESLRNAFKVNRDVACVPNTATATRDEVNADPKADLEISKGHCERARASGHARNRSRSDDLSISECDPLETRAALRRHTFAEMPSLGELRAQTDMIRSCEPLWTAPAQAACTMETADDLASASPDVLRHYRHSIEELVQSSEMRLQTRRAKSETTLLINV